MKLTPLATFFKTKAQLQKELAERRTAIASAERALALCRALESEIPEKIQMLRGAISEPGFVRAECLRQRKIVGALEKLKADLPAIKTHWEKHLRTLTA